jgi:hypothetical protein
MKEEKQCAQLGKLVIFMYEIPQVILLVVAER